MKYSLSSQVFKSVLLLAGCILLVISIIANIYIGATPISIANAVDAIIQYDESSMEQVIVRTTRIPRALIAAVVGASLAIAGAIMQAMTRNPMGDPSILGVNAGASLFVVTAITVFGIGSSSQLMWIAFTGAAIAAMTVYLLGSLGRDGLSSLKIVLAGSAITALFVSFTSGLLVTNEAGLNEVLFWLVGSVAGRPLELLATAMPYILIGWISAFFLSRHLNVLIMGDDAAKGLGQRTIWIKIWGGIIIVILAGCSVAIAGPIGFIGIVIPHMARYFSGIDYRWMIPYSGLFGAILLLLADLLARFIIMPEEIPVGVMTAVIGAPFFIYIARKGLS
jgi:iron complex transport system permease protein